MIDLCGLLIYLFLGSKYNVLSARLKFLVYLGSQLLYKVYQDVDIAGSKK